MATTASAPRRLFHPRALRVITWIAALIAAALVAALLFWLSPQWLPLVGLGESDNAVEHLVEAAAPATAATTVTLPPEKFTATAIAVGKAEFKELAGQRTVPGKLEYRPTDHIEVRSPAAAVVQQVYVEAGQQVEPGTRLCTLTSSEIGLARDEVLAREAELAIANKELAFHEEVAENVATLVDKLTSEPALAQLEQDFSKRRLGAHRETILGAYSKLKLAEAVIQQTSSLDSQGVISGRVREERHSAREVASAAFQTACEQALFDARQQRDKAAATVAHEQRLLKVSQQTLAALLGPYADMAPVTDEASLSEFTLCAPMAATIDERRVTPADRVTLGQELFVLGNSQTLWVSAEVHERDWKLVGIQAGQSVVVTSPALPGQQFTAQVHHLGAAISPETRAVPLMAEIDNSAGLFRPGMFAWVTIPYESADQRLVVPADAVVRHDQRPMVFVPDGERTFRRVDVKTGLETPQWVEIVSGVAVGDDIVTHGAFVLKSELLLEREE